MTRHLGYVHERLKIKKDITENFFEFKINFFKQLRHSLLLDTWSSYNEIFCRLRNKYRPSSAFSLPPLYASYKREGSARFFFFLREKKCLIAFIALFVSTYSLSRGFRLSTPFSVAVFSSSFVSFFFSFRPSSIV